MNKDKIKLAASGALLCGVATGDAFLLDSYISSQIDRDVAACYNHPDKVKKQCISDVREMNGEIELVPFLEIAGMVGTISCGYISIKCIKSMPDNTATDNFGAAPKPWPSREDL